MRRPLGACGEEEVERERAEEIQEEARTQVVTRGEVAVVNEVSLVNVARTEVDEDVDNEDAVEEEVDKLQWREGGEVRVGRREVRIREQASGCVLRG